MTSELERASARMAEPCLPTRLLKTRLTTAEASEYLDLAHGVRIAPATLSKKRCVGGGPKFQKALNSALYPRGELDEWAIAQLGVVRASTSDKGGAPDGR